MQLDNGEREEEEGKKKKKKKRKEGRKKKKKKKKKTQKHIQRFVYEWNKSNMFLYLATYHCIYVHALRRQGIVPAVGDVGSVT
jgi:hypothetical protein